jgi:uncharacterized membrane protein YqiK
MKNNEKAIKAVNENNQKAIEASVNNQKAIEAGMNDERGEIDLDVIDRMFSAVLAANESEETIKSLRPQAEEAVRELLRQLGKPPRFTGTIEYHGFKIRIQRPKSFTWELNTQIDDPQIAYYKAMSRQYDELNMQIKAKRREMKGIAETLALKYPNSESIKSGFSIALMQ